MAVGMTFSLVTAGAAQTQVDGKVELDGGNCSVAVKSGNFDLGTAVWTDRGWSYTPTQNSARLTVEVNPGWTAPGSPGNCRVTLDTESGLSNGSHTINRLYFSATSIQGIGPIVPEQPLAATFDLRAGEATVTMRISHPLPRTFSPGEYTGTFDFTISDGQ